MRWNRVNGGYEYYTFRIEKEMALVWNTSRPRNIATWVLFVSNKRQAVFDTLLQAKRYVEDNLEKFQVVQP